MLAARDATTVLREQAVDDQPDRLGRTVARALVARGGDALASQ
jgi:hypothetical protein